jgi:Rod binding domain-containing protein
MNVTNLATASNVPLEMLAKNQALTDEQKVAEVSRQFEAVLLKQILTEARKPVIQSECNLDSGTSKIYQDMVTQNLADSISKSGTLGLARSLQTQLIHEAIPKTISKEK